VAIIQISRIQVRRGKEQQGTGVPRLTSGELGWAVDTQRLFIGSGSTQEGAPIEGNVRILTETDNILDLSEQYFYNAEFDESGNRVSEAAGAVGRSIQQRLDDFVSADNFGVVKDGLADDTPALQAAIDALFSPNTDRINRAILYIPAGTYRITQPLEIPSFAQIIGAGIENTVLVSDGVSVFTTIGDVDISQIDIDTQPRHIKILNLSIECDLDEGEQAVILRSCRDSEFRNIKLTGTWTTSSVVHTDYAFSFEAVSTLVTCKNNIFENVYIEKFSKGIYSTQQISNNTFKNMNFYDLNQGIEFGELDAGLPRAEGPTLNVIENCEFEVIQQQAIQVLSGNYNTSRSNRFVNVGNEGGAAPIVPVIEFVTNTNISVNDYFDRTEIVSSDVIGSAEYVPEVAGRTKFENLYAVETTVGQKLDFEPFIKLPFIDNGTIFVDYVYTIESLDIVREGVLAITVNKSSLDIVNNSQVVVNDEYTTTGDTVNANELEFNASLASFNPASPIDTIVISAKNSILGLTDDIFYYTIRSKT